MKILKQIDIGDSVKITYRDYLKTVRFQDLVRSIDPLNRDIGGCLGQIPSETFAKIYDKIIAQTNYICNALGVKSVLELRDKKILDAPCGSKFGDGYGILYEPWVCRYLKQNGVDISGIDIEDPHLKYELGQSVSNEKFEFYKKDILSSNFPFEDNSLDLVNVCQFLDSPTLNIEGSSSKNINSLENLFYEANRILKPEGVLLMHDNHLIIDEMISKYE